MDDAVFTVHFLATPIDPSAELRRDLLVEAISTTSSPRQVLGRAEMSELMDQGLIEPWDSAPGVLAELQPDLIVIAGHANVGALAAVDRSRSGAPVALVALGSDGQSLAFPHFNPLFDRAVTVLAVTERERTLIIESHGDDKVHRIGAPLGANKSALSEPNTWVGDTGYILVITDVRSDEPHEETELSRLVRVRFPDIPVGIVHRDSFCVWHHGRLSRGWAPERSSDLARLMAWARLTVDLRPGRLFARRCIDSLLYGVPIVVPEGSRAREHAERGRGGLWFANPAELTWCIEALMDPAIRDRLGEQGRAYAEEEYGSTDRFIDRVTSACKLARTVPACIAD